MREATKFSELSVLPELDFELNYGKMAFVIFTRKKDVFGKTNYSLFSFSLGPTYEQNMSGIDFRLVPLKVDLGRNLWKVALKIEQTRPHSQV